MLINEVIHTFKQVGFNLYKKHLIGGINYTPQKVSAELPPNHLDIISAWKGLEHIIPDIISNFGISQDRMLEFGVDKGFSTAIFSNYFKEVIGVDAFTGDIHAGFRDEYSDTSARLAQFKNIHLVKSLYQDFIASNQETYDLIHVDIIHTYEDTFACGLWAAQHSKCVLFHDTESFIEVRRAVRDIARATKKTFYNYPHYFGLGIVV